VHYNNWVSKEGGGGGTVCYEGMVDSRTGTCRGSRESNTFKPI